MKRLAGLISTLMILGLFAGCATGPGTRNEQLKNKWVDDNDITQITYTFSDNNEGDVTLYFDFFGDTIITGTFTTPEKGKLHLSLTDVTRNEETTSMESLEKLATAFGISLPVKSEMDFSYSINITNLTLVNLEDESVRNCTLAFTEKDLFGSWTLNYKNYTGLFKNDEEFAKTFTFTDNHQAEVKYTSANNEIVEKGTWSLTNNILNYEVTSVTKNGAIIAQEDLSDYGADISFKGRTIGINQNVFYCKDSSTAVIAAYTKTKSPAFTTTSKSDLLGRWRTSEMPSLLSGNTNYYYNFQRKDTVSFKVNDTNYKGSWSISDGKLTITNVQKYNTDTSLWESDSSQEQTWTVTNSKSIAKMTDEEGNVRTIVKQ